jgi:hypothetical protein
MRKIAAIVITAAALAGLAACGGSASCYDQVEADLPKIIQALAAGQDVEDYAPENFAACRDLTEAEQEALGARLLAEHGAALFAAALAGTDF